MIVYKLEYASPISISAIADELVDCMEEEEYAAKLEELGSHKEIVKSEISKIQNQLETHGKWFNPWNHTKIPDLVSKEYIEERI